MSEQLRAALEDARRLAHPFSLSPAQRERIVKRIDAALAAAEPLTYIGGVLHNHDRNRECREVLVGACLVARLPSKARP